MPPQAARCDALARELQDVLSARPAQGAQQQRSWGTQLAVKSTALAAALSVRRHGVFRAAEEGPTAAEVQAEAGPKAEEEAACLYCDPRFVLFEWMHDIVLRERQQALVTCFAAAAHRGRGAASGAGAGAGSGLVHQMIMGGGKTTVLAPLLALLLADGERLLVQVLYPPSLATLHTPQPPA